jgi:hypothetical protein
MVKVPSQDMYEKENIGSLSEKAYTGFTVSACKNGTKKRQVTLPSLNFFRLSG